MSSSLGSEGGCVAGAGDRRHRGPEPGGDEPVELARPEPVSGTGAAVLAGGGAVAAVAYPVREFARAGRLARSLASAHVARALGEHDAAGARAVPGEVPASLWSSRGAGARHDGAADLSG